MSNKNFIQKPFIYPFNESVYAQYTIRTNKRNILKEFLKKHNISSTIYYPKIASEYTYYKKKCKFNELKNASKISKEVLSLPIGDYQSLKELDIFVM